MCDCLNIIFDLDGEITSIDLTTSGTYNGKNYYEFSYNGGNWVLWYDSITEKWYIGLAPDWTNPAFFLAILPIKFDCPDSFASGVNWEAFGSLQIETQQIDCPNRCGNEDRFFKEYPAIILPSDFVEPDRGLEDCCCKFLVLASSSANSWENDITSAWIKTSDTSDTITFKLLKNGNPTTYIPTPVQFPNDSLALYTTINWNDVLLLDGPGCYKLQIIYNISGITGTLNWGVYDLRPYTINNALSTARIRAVFNGKHEFEDIDFTNSDVVSDIRFNGFIGNRQPNMQLDNIIYNNREMKRVIRENLYNYDIITDPLDECFIKPMVETYLLSENQLFISDYNAHNHSYLINDLPVIVEESPEIEYYDFSRRAKLTCKVSDKFKNSRTYY
jgi:hypothetical protein